MPWRGADRRPGVAPASLVRRKTLSPPGGRVVPSTHASLRARRLHLRRTPSSCRAPARPGRAAVGRCRMAPACRPPTVLGVGEVDVGEVVARSLSCSCQARRRRVQDAALPVLGRKPIADRCRRRCPALGRLTKSSCRRRGRKAAARPVHRRRRTDRPVRPRRRPRCRRRPPRSSTSCPSTAPPGGSAVGADDDAAGAELPLVDPTDGEQASPRRRGRRRVGRRVPTLRQCRPPSSTASSPSRSRRTGGVHGDRVGETHARVRRRSSPAVHVRPPSGSSTKASMPAAKPCCASANVTAVRSRVPGRCARSRSRRRRWCGGSSRAGRPPTRTARRRTDGASAYCAGCAAVRQSRRRPRCRRWPTS